MLNIDIRLQTRRHSEAQIAVLAIKPHVDWDEKACRELYQRKRTNGCRKIERKVDAHRGRRNNHLFRNIFLRIYFLDCTCESRLRLLLNTHECIYIYDFRKKGKLFFESIYIYILQGIKTEKWEKRSRNRRRERGRKRRRIKGKWEDRTREKIKEKEEEDQ